MRRGACILGLALLVGCGDSGPDVPVPDRPDALKSAPAVRALRRLYDGAPPVIPHRPMGMTCTQCHSERGMDVADVGFAPPMPHELTAGLSAMSRCMQCHVYRTTDASFVATRFEGLRQNLRKGRRLTDLSPPVLPHPVFMRENCIACHSGPAAREEIRTPHPERTRCLQCHVERVTMAEFSR